MRNDAGGFRERSDHVVRFARIDHSQFLHPDEFSARETEVAGVRREIFDHGRGLVGVHGLWHRADLWARWDNELREARGYWGGDGDKTAVPRRRVDGVYRPLL